MIIFSPVCYLKQEKSEFFIVVWKPYSSKYFLLKENLILEKYQASIYLLWLIVFPDLFYIFNQ